MDYSVYLFDFDYTLANSEEGILKCFYGVLEPNGYDIEAEAIKRTIGMHLTDAFALLTNVSDKNTIKRFCDEFFYVANIEMTNGTFLFPDVIPLLSKLKREGKKIGIVSTKRRMRINETLLKFDMFPLVDIVVGVEDVTAFKPSPEGVYKALDVLNEKKENTLYIGDSIIDAQTAKNAGVAFIGVTTGTTLKSDLEVFPNIKIIDNLSRLI